MPSSVQLIRSPNLSSVAEYAYAATAPSDARMIFLANLQEALAAASATLQDVISTRVLVTSDRQKDLVAAWQVVRDTFGEHDVPSTLLGVTVLGYAGQLVEIEAVAAVVD